METRICKVCGMEKDIHLFDMASDAYTTQKRWRRRTCRHCYYKQSSRGKRTKVLQFTTAQVFQ